MPDVHTPGEAAYHAAQQEHLRVFPQSHDIPWRHLRRDAQQLWEAAAQAVLAWKKEKDDA